MLLCGLPSKTTFQYHASATKRALDELTNARPSRGTTTAAAVATTIVTLEVVTHVQRHGKAQTNREPMACR